MKAFSLESDVYSIKSEIKWKKIMLICVQSFFQFGNLKIGRMKKFSQCFAYFEKNCAAAGFDNFS